MSLTATPGHRTTNGSGPTAIGIQPAKRRQRSLPFAVVALACMVTAIVAFVGIQLAATDRQAVLAISKPVSAGETLTADDLSVAQVAEDPALDPVPLSQMEAVVGQTAAVDLAPGALLTESAVGESSPLDAGESLVGIEVLPSAAPVDAIRPGDRVQVVAVDTSADGEPKGLGEVLAEGRVVRVSPSRASGSGAATVSVAVPSDAAPAVAGASVGQRAALVVVG